MVRVRYWLSFLALCCLSLGLVACNEGVPEFEKLSSLEVPKPIPNSDSVTVNAITDKFHLTGTCDPRIGDIKVKIDPYRNWAVVSAFAQSQSSINCSADQTFSFNLPSLSELSSFDPAQKHSVTAYLKSVTTFGESAEVAVQLYYVPPTENSMKFLITAGAGRNSSTNYKVRAAIRVNESVTSTSSNYKIKGRVNP